jgi:hypothetical protein
MTAQRFIAMVTKSGSKTFIVLPFNPNEVWGAKQRHHTTGTINGCNWRGALAADGDAYVLALGPAWRRDNRVEAGVEVEVELTPEGPQTDALAPDVAAALDAAPDAQAFFASLATFYRNGYLRWIAGARRPEIRQARITELISLLRAGKKQR